MANPIDRYWIKKVQACADALEKNHFDVYSVAGIDAVKPLIADDILPKLAVESASWGDSMTLLASGIIEHIDQLPEIRLIKTFEAGVSRETILERRRQALLTDLFLTGTNAVTQTGNLVNLDMIGNRIAGITFGPRTVIIVVGRNKIVNGVEQAMERIRSYAAPLNAIRHPGWRTPCVKTGVCMDCRSPDRICNTWTITEKSYPKGRIKIILVNEDLGL